MNMLGVFETDYTFGEILSLINIVIIAFAMIVFFHHQVFLILSFFVKSKKYKGATKNHKFAYIICARNEELVIGELIKSINKQNYPKELMQVFVIADNCTDNTAKIAADNNAIVYERFNKKLIGKSYALDEIMKFIIKNYPDNEAFIVFDADNLVDSNFTLEMNKAYDEGYKICTSFRNSKNYGQSWIASGAGMLFYRECRIMHRARSALNLSTYVSGTGFLVDKQIIIDNGGWVHHRMIEDVEFSISELLKGNKVMYVEKAIFYDEHPIKIKDSWNQRLRWCKGTHQCFSNYEGKLIKRFFKTGDFSCIDLGVHVFPAPLITFIWLLLLPILYGIYGIIASVPIDMYIRAAIFPIIDGFVYSYGYAFIVALITTIMIWKKIPSKGIKKIIHCFTFPIYMYTYLLITTIAAFKKVAWVPIKHDTVKTIEEISNKEEKQENL